MTVRAPLVLGADGLPQQLQAGDTLSAPTTAPDIISITNGESSAAIVIGAPVYISAAATAKKARANAKATSHVAGLGYDVSIPAAGAGYICTSGTLTATTAQWDAVAGTTGGLTYNTYYFLDPANVGNLTATPPSTVGQCNVLIGRALSSVDLELMVQPPVLL